MKIFASLAVVAVVVAMSAFVAFGTSLVPGPPAMAQSVSAPANQDADHTGTAGEVEVTWDGVDGAYGYRVGWVNHEDFQRGGGEWLRKFSYAHVPATVRRYVVNGLTGGQEYWFIVASVDEVGRVYFPDNWVRKLRVSGTPSPTAHCPGVPSDGTGAYCPITGLRLVDRYYGMGERADWDNFGFTVTGAEMLSPGRYHEFHGDSLLGIGKDWFFLPSIAGRRYLQLKVAIANNERYVQLNPGREYAMDTNAGVAFVLGGARDSRKGSNVTTELVFEIPDGASVVVLALRPLYSYTDAEWNEPKLFQISLQGRSVAPGGLAPGR